MKKQKKLAAAVASFGAATMCLVGGTFAWYVVSNTGTAIVSGTTVSGGALQIGIKSANNDLIGTGTGKLSSDDFEWDDTNSCYWPKNSSALDATTISTIFTDAGYSNSSGRVDLLTSGSFDDGDVINIKPEAKVADNQSYTDNVFNDQVITADTSKSGENHDSEDKNVYANEEGGRYISFELVLRTYNDTDGGEKNCPIYLSDSTFLTTTGDSANALNKSIRVGLESGDTSSIFSPSQYESYSDDADYKKTINVGGLLDKEPADGVNDHYTVKSTKDLGGGNIINNFTHYEYWFGEYEELEDDEETGGVDESKLENHYVAATGLTSANAILPDNSISGSTFNAFQGKHLWVGKGSHDNAYENDVLMVLDSDVVAKTQVSHGLDYYIYHTGADAATLNHPLANTGDSGTTTVKVTIWVEGWDPASTNNATGSFTLNTVFYAPTLKNFR